MSLNLNSKTNKIYNIYYLEKNRKYKLYKTFRFLKLNNNSSSKTYYYNNW